jgi:cytochrome c2
MTFFRWLVVCAASSTLAWAAETSHPPATATSVSDDLVLSGKFLGVGSSGKLTVTRAELLQVKGVVDLDEKPARPIAKAPLRVLPLDALLAKWPLAAGADGLVLICGDRWESFLPVEFIQRHRPYLLLLYDGRTPAQGWPSFGGIEPLAPYFCNVTTSLGPKAEDVQEHGTIDATQIVEIRAVNTAERYAPFYAGALAKLSPAADAGRKLFLRECNVCHQGPGGVGGNVSQRPLAVLEVHATVNADYFRKFVRNPKQFMPQTMMPKHEAFTDEMLDQLIAFLSATKAAGAAGIN